MLGATGGVKVVGRQREPRQLAYVPRHSPSPAMTSHAQQVNGQAESTARGATDRLDHREAWRAEWMQK